MLTYDQALAQILAQVTPLEPVQMLLFDSLGLVLAEDIVAPIDLPPFANSSMDGFAVRAEDVQVVPAMLPISGDIPAGVASVPKLLPGTALRIMTGAPLPPGADAVVPVEETETQGQSVVILTAAQQGQCIRPAGEDVKMGSIVVTTGSRLRPAEIGMCAAVGRMSVRTYPRPRVAIISTGDELVEPGQTLQSGQIYNSNAYSLAAQVSEAGGIVTHQLHAKDTPDALRAAFDLCVGADILLTSGGVSVGDYDYVKAVLAERGTVDFCRVAIRPGKPLAFGQWGKTLFFGLPGNPVSSMVTFELFVRPALRQMAGHTHPLRQTISARLTEEAAHHPGRQSYLRAVVTCDDNGYTVRPVAQQGSGMLRSMVTANALLIMPSKTAVISAGETATVLLLD